METGREPKTPGVDLAQVQERLTEHIENFNQEPDHNMVQRLDFDCMAVAVIFGRIADNPTDDDINEATLFIREHRDLFSTPLTAADLENSLDGYGFGINFDRMLNRLAEQVDHYHKLESSPPSVPAEVLVAFADRKDKISPTARYETLRTVVRVYSDETARSTFRSLAEELIDRLNSVSSNQLRIYRLTANGLLAAAKQNFEGILAAEHGSDNLAKFNELSKLAAKIKDQEVQTYCYKRPGITDVKVSDEYL